MEMASVSDASSPPPSSASPPLVTVLLPVHNGCTPSPDALHSSIRSILTQSLTSLHLLLIDDASTDSTPSILSHYALIDPRIAVVTHPTRLGVAAALNTALHHCPPSPFLARMDADDLSHPTRLSAQLAYLATHPTVDVVGTAVQVESNDRSRVVALPTSVEMTHWAMPFYCALAHPSVVWRRGVVPSYSSSPLHAHVEDVELWLRLLRGGRQLTSLSAPPLVTLHRHSSSASALHRSQQRHSALHLAREHWELSTQHRVGWRAVVGLVEPAGLQTVGQAVEAAALLLLIECARVAGEGRGPAKALGARDVQAVTDDVTNRLGELAMLAMMLKGGAENAEAVDGGDECGVKGCVWEREKKKAVSGGWPGVPPLMVDANGLLGSWLKRSGGAQSRQLLAKLLT